MKKIFFVLYLTFASTHYFIPFRVECNAGILKWGAKKIISSSVKLIFSHAKDKFVDYNKNKLIEFLKKNPQYKEYSKKLIKKQINKYPNFTNRGYILIQKIEALNNIRIK